MKTLVATPDSQRPLVITYTGDEAALIRRIAKRRAMYPKTLLWDTLIAHESPFREINSPHRNN